MFRRISSFYGIGKLSSSSQTKVAIHPQATDLLQDHAEAVKWYRKAAEQGYAKAQGNFGIMYAYGKGVPQDDSEAYVWSSLAATSGDGNAVQNSGILAKKLAPEVLDAAQKRSTKLYAEIQLRKE